MTKQRNVLLMILVSALLISLFPPATPKTSAANAIQTYVNNMQPGWNLGNSLDATGADETSWGNPRITRDLINQIAAQGYKSIRIPVTWHQHMGGAPNYTIESAYMNRVDEVVGWAMDANLYVMINLHHDSWLWTSSMEPKYNEVLARYNAAWTQIANRFKDRSSKLMFESINEPRFSEGGTTDENKMFQMLDVLNTSFHRIIRASGGQNGTRPLVLPTLETTPSTTRMNALYQTIVKLNDPNLIATVHYYGFWPFSVNIAGFTKFNQETQNDITQTFDNVYNMFVAKGIPVIVGEFGLLGFDKNTGVVEQGEKLKFFEYLTYYFKQKSLTGMLWDNGQHFNRQTFQWSDPDLYNIIKAGLTTRSSTADSDLIYVTKGVAVQDAKLNLNLNGNTLSSISLNGQNLVNGQDYTLSGSALTIKASKLSQLTSSGKLGVNAVLTAKFSKGADWKFHVILYNTPVLSNKTGTTSSYAIPTSFNGDQLATMEATYANGGNAGPQNWTSYKEFAYAFTPSYSTNEIKLLPAFFNEVQDGKVNLKFHFWSGKVVTYTITKSGSNITGTTP